MPAIPPALLRRLYVEGSLRNRPDGFEFILRNRLAPSTILRLGPLTIDDRAVAQDLVQIQTKRNVRSITRVTDKAPHEPGSHRLAFAMSLKEVGELTLRVEDAPDNGITPGS